MEFSNLMLIHTRPAAWLDPSGAAERLRDFLLFLVDPTKDGLAMLGRRTTEGSTALTWVDAHEASAVVASTYDEVWLPGADLLQAQGREASNVVFDAFAGQTMELFIDRARFDACVSRVTGGTPPEDVDFEYYVGLSVDWAHLRSGFGVSLFWAPQLRISNFWPSTPRLAPPSDGAPAPEPMSAIDAANVLQDRLWFDIETRFEHVRGAFHLRELAQEIEGRSLMPPVFYWAEPTTVPEHPEAYLLSEFAPIDRLGQVLLGTSDTLSAGTTGAGLEGNLLALRREFLRPNQMQAYYLMLPWWHGAREDWVEEVEEELARAADRLAFIELTAALRAHDLATDLAAPLKLIALWRGAVDTAAELSRDLHDLALYEPAASKQKIETYQMVNQVRRALARLEGDMLRITDEQQSMPRRQRTDLEASKAYGRRALAERPVNGVDPLIEGLSAFFPYQWMMEEASAAAERAGQLRETFRGVERAIHDLLEQERREEREREAQLLQEARERQERAQHLLGYALAALAAVSAFPILIGQMDWTELQAIVDDWPGPARRLGTILTSVHPYLVLFATISAVLTIAALLGLLIWTLLRRKPSQSTESAEPDELEKVGQQVQLAWQLAREAVRVSQRLVDTPGPIDDLDRQACDLLVQVWEWLQNQYADRPDETDLERLRRSVRRFVILTELFAKRPEPFRLPLALCLFHYKSTDFVRYPVVSEVEFEQTFRRLGFDHGEVQAIARWAESEVQPDTLLRLLPPREFVQALRERAGVSAVRAQPILPPPAPA